MIEKYNNLCETVKKKIGEQLTRPKYFMQRVTKPIVQ